MNFNAYPYALAAFLVSAFIIIKKCRTFDILKPTLWFYLAYAFLFITHIFGGFVYKFGSILHILPYVIICLALFLIGYYLAFYCKSRIVQDFVTLKLSTIAKISIIGGILTAFDFFRLNTILIGMRIEDQELSLIGVIGNAMACLGIIVWLFGLYNYLISNLKITGYAYISLICYVIYDILSGGRQSIFMIAISSLIIILWCLKQRKNLSSTEKKVTLAKNFPWFGVIIIVLFCCYFFIVSLFRSQIDDIDNKIAMFEENTAVLSKPSDNFIHTLGPLSDMYVEEMFYYSHEFYRLDALYKNYDFPPLLGIDQFPYIARRFEWLTGNLKELSWNAQEKALGSFSAHTWGTILCDYIIDFGRYGAILAFLLTGTIVGRLTKHAKKKNDNIALSVRQCILCTGIIFSIQFSPFLQMSWIVPLVFISYFGVINISTNVIEQGTCV